MPVAVFEPIRIGAFNAKNRLVFAPMTTYSGMPNGEASPDEIAYYRDHAPGYGVMMTAACCVHESGWAFPGQWRCDSDAMMPSLIAVAEACKADGGLAILQIHHGGRMCPSSLCKEVVAPSAVKYPQSDRVEAPRAMTLDEIEIVIRAFAEATRRAVDAGFDGVEIHGANTYLLQQFVSPSSNLREDAFGQDRYLFSKRVTEAVVEAAHGKIVVGYRFSPEEPWENGITLDITADLIERLAEFPLDFLHASLSRYDQPSIRTNEGPSVLSQLRQMIPSHIPLIGVGGVQGLDTAKGCLENGADLVAVGKVALTCPDFPAQLRSESPNIPTRIQKSATAHSLRIPEGLYNRIMGAPGWFDVE